MTGKLKKSNVLDFKKHSKIVASELLKQLEKPEKQTSMQKSHWWTPTRMLKIVFKPKKGTLNVVKLVIFLLNK